MKNMEMEIIMRRMRIQMITNKKTIKINKNMILLYMPSKIYNKKSSKKMRPKLSRKKNKTFRRKQRGGGENKNFEKKKRTMVKQW